MDPNILACKDSVDLLEQYADSRAVVDFNQGLDIRIMQPKQIEIINRTNIKRVHFAWDNPTDNLEDKFRMYSELSTARGRSGHGWKGTVYCLTNFESVTTKEHIDRALYRIYKLRDLNYQPYVMIYDKEHADKDIKRLQRWCNSPQIFWSTKTFEEYSR